MAVKNQGTSSVKTVSTFEELVSGTGLNFESNFYERSMDDASLVAGNPDDTLIFFGPPRYQQRTTGNVDASEDRFYIVGFGQGLQVQAFASAMMNPSIGTGLKFSTKGGENVSAAFSRMVFSESNILSAITNTILKGSDMGLSNNATKKDIKDKLDVFSYPPSSGSDINPNNSNSKVDWSVGLGSEIFHIPFGLGILMRDKRKRSIGGLYLEVCMIMGWNLSFFAGQGSVAENCNFTADRLLPIQANDTVSAKGSDFWGKVQKWMEVPKAV